MTRNEDYLSAMRYWREVNNEEVEEVEEKEEEEVKKEEVGRQNEGDATLRIKMTVIFY